MPVPLTKIKPTYRPGPYHSLDKEGQMNQDKLRRFVREARFERTRDEERVRVKKEIKKQAKKMIKKLKKKELRLMYKHLGWKPLKLDDFCTQIE